MSDSEAPSMLLTSSGDSVADSPDLMKAGLLGGGALAIILFNKRKKEKKEGGEEENKAPVAKGMRVAFSKDYASYEVGEDWRDSVLEPYLEDAAEERALATASWQYEDSLPMSSVRLNMDRTRETVLEAFFRSHTVDTHEGEKMISQLPNADIVRQFKSQVGSWTQKFQETF